VTQTVEFVDKCNNEEGIVETHLLIKDGNEAITAEETRNGIMICMLNDRIPNQDFPLETVFRFEPDKALEFANYIIYLAMKKKAEE
jgi:hypothetical protein